jgi:hypothetical protein
LFVALAKRYFQEHPESKSLSLPIPLPVNMRKFMIPPLPPTVLAPQQGVLSISCYIQRGQLEQSLSNKASTIELLKKQALLSKNQVQNALFKNVPTRFKPLDAPLLAAAMYRTHLNKFWTVQYVSNDVLFCFILFWSYVNLTFIFSALTFTTHTKMGDISLSNMGVYRPSPTLVENGLVVESTSTFSSPTMANYEFICCNTILDGTMTLSMSTDHDTMSRTRGSCRSLLSAIQGLLLTMIDE